MKHLDAPARARYWLCSGFSGHFFGAHLLGGEFNYGGMLPFGITLHHPGWAASATRLDGGSGIGYGYNWVLGKRWNLEATLGVGTFISDTTASSARPAADKLGSGSKNYLSHQGRHLPYLYNKVTNQEAKIMKYCVLLCGLLLMQAVGLSAKERGTVAGR